MACLEAGHTSEALDLADELISEAREQDNPMLLAMGLLLRGMALHAWEQFGDAGRAFEEASRLALREDVGAHGVYRDVALAQAALCLDLGQPERARELVRQVEQASSPVEPPHELHQMRAERILGQVALAERAPAEAIRRFSAALELGERLEDSLERGLAAHGLSQALALAGEDQAAAERRAEAKRILRERGASHQLRRLAYSDRPRLCPSGAGPNESESPGSRPTEPGPVSDVNPTSHLGDTQYGLALSGETRPGPGGPAGDVVAVGLPASRADK
jgi:tetratricopeptide (TPR) repeat protein